MLRFCRTLLALCVLMVLTIIVMHAVQIMSMMGDVNRTFTLKEDQDVLFIGSSQVGCAIVESPQFHNRVSWISDTIVQSYLMRLKEYERRGQLKDVKVCVVPFNVFSITAQNKKAFKWAWYQEIAISWRYLDMLPCGRLEFARYIACNLRFPFMIHVQDGPPMRDGLTARPKQFRERFFKGQDAWARSLSQVKGSYPGWEENVFCAYEEMREICNRHQIRFVIFRAPVLPRFDHLIPETGQRMVREWENRFRNSGFEYVDTEHEMPEKYFFDSVHLICDGAELFTEDLYRRMSVPFAGQGDE